MAATTPHNRRGGGATVRHHHPHHRSGASPPSSTGDVVASGTADTTTTERKTHKWRRPPVGVGAGRGGRGGRATAAASAFVGSAMIASLRYRRLLLRSDGGGRRERTRLLCAGCLLLLAFLLASSRSHRGRVGEGGGVLRGDGVGVSGTYNHHPRLWVSEGSGFRLLERSADGTSGEEEPHGYEPYRKRTVDFSKEEVKFQRSLKNSKLYDHWRRDPLHEGDCVPMRWWQETSFPSCDKFHELGIGDVHDVSESKETFASLARGGYNDVFKVKHVDGRTYVLKVLQGPYDTDFTDRNFDRVRRDSLIMERTTASPYVMDIYGFCGFGQLVTYSREGNLDEVLWRWNQLDQETKLRLAAQVAMGLTAVHDTDGDGISAMSHGDFAAKQYIRVGDVYKLNDFNRGRFIRWNEKKKEPCTYTIGVNDGVWRAPEEYKYEPETSKIDVWALGSIFFEIVTGRSVWDDFSEKEARRLLMKGDLPPIREEVMNSDDPIDRVLLEAIDMCYVYDPAERPNAREVSDFLVREAKRLGVEVEVT